MTETTVEIRQVAAYSNLISSKILADHMNAYLEKLGPITYTEEEYAYAQKFQQSLFRSGQNNLTLGDFLAQSCRCKKKTDL